MAKQAKKDENACQSNSAAEQQDPAGKDSGDVEAAAPVEDAPDAQDEEASE